MRPLATYRFLLLICLGLLSQPSFAISNIEKERTSKNDDGWNGNIRLKFEGKDGNNEETELGLGLHARWNNDKISWLNWYNREYDRYDGDTTDDDTFAHTRLIHNHREVIASEYFLQYEQDPFSGLKRRFLQGIGLRWHSWNKPNSGEKQSSGDAFQGLGIFSEHIREVDLGETQSEHLYRANIYSHWLYQHSGERAISASVTVYIQPNLADTDDLKGLLQAQVSLPINEKLHFQWKLQGNWDSRPPSGKAKKTHETLMELKYIF